VGEVEAAGALVGGFQVGGDALVLKCGVAGVQQCGACALPLPVRADSQDGQVVVEDSGRVVPVELLVEGQEPVQSPGRP
jgi:hypothetical protein